MLPNLLDAAGMQTHSGCSGSQFLNAMMQGLVPQAVGIFHGVALWNESAVITLRKALAHNGEVLNAPLDPVLQTAQAFTQATPTEPTPSNTHAETDGDVKAALARLPELVNQTMAARTLHVAAGWLGKMETKGYLSSMDNVDDGQQRLYKRDDLAALVDLPVYQLRRRHGYTAGQPKPDKVKTRAPAPVATLPSVEAAKYLGIPASVLQMTRTDGSGPVWRNVDGVPTYAVHDLDAFKATMNADTLPRFVARAVRPVAPGPNNADAAPDPLHDFVTAAAFLGLTPKALQQREYKGVGPARASEPGKPVRFRESALVAWRAAHPLRAHATPAKSAKPAKRKANRDAARVAVIPERRPHIVASGHKCHSAAGAAAFLQMPLKQFYNLRAAGTGPRIAPEAENTTALLYRESDLIAWREQFPDRLHAAQHPQRREPRRAPAAPAKKANGARVIRHHASAPNGGRHAVSQSGSRMRH